MNETESLGEYLRKERESRKISLKEVSKKIRVREHFLKAVEEDRHDLLPSRTYVKGFLSAYARYIGLDSNALLLRYENSLKEKPEAQEEIPSEKRKLWGKKYLWVIGGLIIAGFVASYLLLFPARPPTEPVSPMSEVNEIPPQPPPLQAPLPEAEPLPIPEEQPITLQLMAVETTWVSFQLDDQPEQDIILQPGEGVSYRATGRIQLIVGNAGGLDLIFNGKKLERVGKSGEVFSIIFTPQGVESKPREKPKPPEGSS